METQARNLCQAQGSLTKQKSCFAQVINRPKKGCGAIYEGHGQERFIRVWPSDGLSGSRAPPVWLRISAASHFLIDSLALQSATPSTQRVLFKSGCPSPGWRAAQHTAARTPPVAAWDPRENHHYTLSEWEQKLSLHGFSGAAGLSVIRYLFYLQCVEVGVCHDHTHKGQKHRMP